MTKIQFLTLIFALVQCYFTFLHFKRKEFTIRECLGWLLVWVALALVALFPSEFTIFSGSLGTIRSLDLFTILGFFLVLSITFYTYVELDRLRRKLEKMVRDNALKELE